MNPKNPLRRELQLQDLNEVLRECQQLASSGYYQNGNWTLGQICRHLRSVQDPSLDGYPRWMSLFAFLRPMMRWLLLPRLLSGRSPKGIPTARGFLPPEGLNDAAEVRAFAESISRFQRHTGPFHPHPAFGQLSRPVLESLHASHAAHHLSFLSPLPKGD